MTGEEAEQSIKRYRIGYKRVSHPIRAEPSPSLLVVQGVCGDGLVEVGGEKPFHFLKDSDPTVWPDTHAGPNRMVCMIMNSHDLSVRGREHEFAVEIIGRMGCDEFGRLLRTDLVSPGIVPMTPSWSCGRWTLDS
ncbi:MAG: hypothetical protein AMXMBFR67_01050 [Nitrospira sp.]